MRPLPLLVASCALLLLSACGSGPDVTGTVSLAPGVTVPQAGSLVVRAIRYTKMDESLRVEKLQVPIGEVTFPYEFVLRGQGPRVNNDSWAAFAYVSEDVRRGHAAAGELGDMELFGFTCTGDGTGCSDARVELVLDVVQ